MNIYHNDMTKTELILVICFKFNFNNDYSLMDVLKRDLN
jgi:hypothetical protein